MKQRLITITAVLAALGSAQVMADNTVTFSKEIAPKVLNEKGIDSGWFETTSELTTQNGQNQLVVTLGQIVVEDGRRVKYDSDPYVIDFAASDAQLSLSYKPFRTIEDARSFAKQPDFSLMDDQGNRVQHSVTKLHIGGLQLMQDYEGAVKKHNHGDAPLAAATPATAPASPAIDVIKTGFDALSASEQKAFMMWAMENMKK